MDLEVVGRHALLFDDDAMAAFVNSSDALVDWHSLQIDRYDVRHLLSSPPPSRRRNRNSKPVLLDDSSLESQLDHERYLDLPSHPDQPDVEEDEDRTDTLGYRAVAFLYGDTADSVDKKNADAEMESSGFLPRFPIPGDLLQSLPPTEKVHQIIARTALFVSTHGGQSEIILRVKQGDNPTFGFLMPGHHLHAYFRFLVDHPQLLHIESDKNVEDEQKKSVSDHNESTGVNGALTLLGSVYGSGEEDEGDEDIVKPDKVVPHDSTYSFNHSTSHSSKNIESDTVTVKDEPVSKNPALSNREKVLIVKRNSSITTSKSETAKFMEEKSCLFSGAADKSKSMTVGMTSKTEPVTVEPLPELKRLIEKLVEVIVRNGKQFEANLIEQDSEHRRFPFLLPSNLYHSYYLKVLQKAQESKLNHQGSNSGKNGPLERRADQNASTLEEMPPESDKKERFKMVIGKSKKEAHDLEAKEAPHGCGIDAAAAAAILQAATRGTNSQSISINSSSGHVIEGEIGKSQDLSRNISAVDAHSEAHLTKEQKLKAERLKRAKMFVATLKSATLRSSTLEPPLESRVSRSVGEVNLDFKKREPSLAPSDATDEKPDRNYFGEHNERPSKRKYRSRTDVPGDDYDDNDDDDDDDDGDENKHNDCHSKRKPRSKSRRHNENDSAIEPERKHRRRRRRAHSSSEENRDEVESSEVDSDRKHYKAKLGARDPQTDDYEDEYKEDKYRKRARKKHRRRRHRSRSYSDESKDEGESSEEDKHRKSKHGSRSREDDDLEDDFKVDENRKHKRKKHRSHSRKAVVEEEDDDYGRDGKRSRTRRRSSHGGREKNGRSRRENKSRCKRKHDTSSGDERQSRNRVDKINSDGRNELEEGEISSRVSEESRGTASGDVALETFNNVSSSRQGAPSRPCETSAEVPDDLRAKIRAMLMSTLL